MMREYSARTQHELNETQQATACDNIFGLLMSAKIMSELYKAVYTVILETDHDLERKIQFRKYHFLKCGLNKLINVVIENSI